MLRGNIEELLSLEADMTLLDVGGGTGALVAPLADQCREIIVLEPSARQRERGAKKHTRLKFVAGRAEALPFPGARFDRVLASRSFHHFEDQDKALEEVRRVLRPGGWLVIVEFAPRTFWGRAARFITSRSHHGHGTFFEPDALKRKLEEQGFREIQLHILGSLYAADARV